MAVPDGQSETSVVEHELRVAARPQTVFAYFTDPERLTRWIAGEATVDPRPGGICRIDVTAEIIGDTVLVGEFLTVDPYRRIVFTWGFENHRFEMPPQSTEVEVTFTPAGDDTIVRLVHRRLPPAAIDFHRAGWEHYLGRLGVAAAGGDPGPDPWRVPATAH